MKNIKIKIKNEEYNLKYSIRAFFLFERITGHSFSLETFADQVLFFYCLLLASNPNMTLTFDDFINAIDEQEIDLTLILKFVEELQKQLEELRDKTDNSKKKGSKKKS